MKDIIIIGAGVVGSSIARELSRYKLDVLVLEKNNEVANEASKGNTAIVHAGYDPKPETLMAKLNVLGNEMFDELAKELGFPFSRNKSLVVAVDENEREVLYSLLERGKQNGVKGLKIIEREEILKIEPNISDEVKYALLAETGAIVSPWQLTENLIENAIDNGVRLHLSEKVLEIINQDEIFTVKTDKSIYQSKIVINCAGVNSDDIHNLICEKKFTITPVRGEYLVYSHFEGSKIKSSIFQVPTDKGKGILVTPTAHGHLIIGPTADKIEDKNDKSTTTNTFDMLIKSSKKSVKNINYGQPLREYAGIRANSDYKDFYIKEDDKIKGFIDVACIKSPGLTAAPAISKYVLEILKNTKRIDFVVNETFNPYRRKQKVLYTYPKNERDKVIKEDPNFGILIDRHENITKGDIIDIIKRNAGATTLNGVKRRTRCGASESQMVYSMPKVINILSETLNKDVLNVYLEENGSYIFNKKSNYTSKDISFKYNKFDFNNLKDEYETIIIGAGIKGLKEAKRRSLKGEEVLVVDSLPEIGGLKYEICKFESAIREDLDLDVVNNLVSENIKYLVETSLFDCDSDNKIVDLISQKGYRQVKYKNLVLAQGRYEANRETLKISGSRPSGIFTAMQCIRLLNELSYLFGTNAVIYGVNPETIKLLERLEKENVNINMIILDKETHNKYIEKLSKYKVVYSEIVEIKGMNRLESVILNTGETIKADTLILSKYYIPENVLTKKLKLNLDESDNVIVDENSKTSVESIYLI